MCKDKIYLDIKKVPLKRIQTLNDGAIYLIDIKGIYLTNKELENLTKSKVSDKK